MEGSGKLSKKDGETSINVSFGKKGFFERIAENISKGIKESQKVCKNCGRFIDKPFSVCAEQQRRVTYKWQQEILCKECAKKCKKCGKYFCPKHIKKHKCI